MNAALAAQQTTRVQIAPRLKARMAGVLYILEGATSVFGQFIVLGRLVVHDDAAATAHNILANESLFWAGFASGLLAVVFHLTYTVLFYGLLKPVNSSVALLALLFSIVACTLQAMASLFPLAALRALQGGAYAKALTADQLHALALLFLQWNAQAFNVYLVFFGCWLLVIGYLIVRSTFLPRLLGVLVMLAFVSWLTLLAPPIANALYPFYLAFDAPGEIALVLWLLVVGLNEQRWQEQAGAAEAIRHE
jgi:hypothetical protein